MVWMRGKARHSPACRKIKDIDDRVARLSSFQAIANLAAEPQAEFRQRVGEQPWDAYRAKLQVISRLLVEADLAATQIRLLANRPIAPAPVDAGL